MRRMSDELGLVVVVVIVLFSPLLFVLAAFGCLLCSLIGLSYFFFFFLLICVVFICIDVCCSLVLEVVGESVIVKTLRLEVSSCDEFVFAVVAVFGA